MVKFVKRSFLFVFFIGQSILFAQSSQVLHELKKLQNPARVLYLAAHPDDENTRLISYLANEVGAQTAYLSLTRGDGGQNLIGNQLSEKLGVLRTQELMQARALDGGQQFFTRAVDFGYSKTAEETFEKWNKEEVLKDVVHVIRKFQPDIIITRFPPDKRAGHGHHTASAILAEEAFSKAADETFAPKQLDFVTTWQPKRLYWNTSTWWGLPLDSLYKTTNDYIRVDVGGYDANLGKSYNEIASLSRTQHKSQGFGVSISRGSQMEYLMHVKGEKATTNMFEGIASTWKGEGAANIDKQLKAIIENFDPLKPQNSLKELFVLRTMADKIKDEKERNTFVETVNEILLMASGIRAEALGNKEYVSSGDSLEVRLQVINRLNIDANLITMEIHGGEILLGHNDNQALGNEIFEKKFKIKVKERISSQPYWLKSDYKTLFKLDTITNLGKPENDPVLFTEATFSTEYGKITVQCPVRYKYSDRVEGEIEKPVAVLPEILVDLAIDNLIFTSVKPKELTLNFTTKSSEKYTVTAKAEGFDISPSTFTVENNGTQQLSITPLSNSAVANLQLSYNGEQLMQLTELDYPHIDKRIVLNTANPKLVSIPLTKRGALVGYIPGAGDEVAKAIMQMGYEVDILDENAIKTYELKNYKAIVTGIRAYNTEEWLPGVKSILMEYVQSGGNFIVQYNTRSRDLISTDLGPYPFTLSRKRVTEEDAEATFQLPEHPVLNKPNKLGAEDFEGWVQERGLYFADEWDEAYQTPLAWHDAGEEDLLGGLLIADYGKGAFMYTGISFFREVPAGVPGAYRLLANLISYKQTAP